jgi:hypothetical protein
MLISPVLDDYAAHDAFLLFDKLCYDELKIPSLLADMKNGQDVYNFVKKVSESCTETDDLVDNIYNILKSIDKAALQHEARRFVSFYVIDPAGAEAYAITTVVGLCNVLIN